MLFWIFLITIAHTSGSGEVIYEMLCFVPAGFISMVLNKLMKPTFPTMAGGLPVVSFGILLDMCEILEESLGE